MGDVCRGQGGEVEAGGDAVWGGESAEECQRLGLWAVEGGLGWRWCG